MNDANFRPLISDVITQAIWDLKSKEYQQALDAMEFLTGDDFPLWAEAAGIPELEFNISLVPKAWKQIARRASYERTLNGRYKKTGNIGKVRRPRAARN